MLPVSLFEVRCGRTVQYGPDRRYVQHISYSYWASRTTSIRRFVFGSNYCLLFQGCFFSLYNQQMQRFCPQELVKPPNHQAWHPVHVQIVDDLYKLSCTDAEEFT